MAADAAAIARPRSPARTGWRLTDSAFVLVLLLVFVGLSPFATRDPIALAAGGTTGTGDIARQIAYSGAFLFIGFAAMRAKGFGVLAAIPPLLALLLFWCLISAAWAP